ncbi:MAG TPA: hypothetical protein VK731_00125 [Candidatus Cybelea sp.]|jgi:hypothetical protein|nr:hypothetical protein [Candidatus Cybelea sp.]
MKNHQHKTKNHKGRLVINIAPEDWRVTARARVNICQQPAKIIFWPPLPAPRLPRLDTWQLGDSFPVLNQQLF